VARNGDEAVRWYQKATAQNYAQAEFKLGLLYYEGTVIAQDLTEGLRWLQKAAGHGSAAAENEIAFAYEHGKGVPQNYEQAAKWYRMAAEHGLPEARHNLEILAARQETSGTSVSSEDSLGSSGNYAGPGQGFVGGRAQD